jgi:hypothetical protein
MNGLATTPRISMQLRLEEVPSYLQRYAVEVDTWARQAGARPVLRTIEPALGEVAG